MGVFPSLAAVRNTHSGENKEKGLAVISFSLDTEKEKWAHAAETDMILWMNISDLKGNDSPTMKDFQINFLPTNVLVNSRGIIIGVNVFEKSDIEALLKQ